MLATSPLTLIAAQITSGDFTVTNACGNSLAAHSSCALAVAYVPKSVGVETGVLTVSDQFRSQTIPLSGTGLAPPGVSLLPTGGLAFGAYGVGLSAPAQTLTLTNNGGVALSIAQVNVTGDFATVTGTNTCPASLAPAAACTVAIAFLPTAAGPRTGMVTFSDNAANSPQVLALTGTGVDFTLAPDGATSMSIASGSTATYTLLFSSPAGLTGSAGFTCAGRPAHALCTVNPGSAALGTTSVVTVTVATGLATATSIPPPSPWSRTPALWWALLLPAGVFVRMRRTKVSLVSLISLVWLAALLVGLSACSTPRTIPGSTSQTPVTAPRYTQRHLHAGGCRVGQRPGPSGQPHTHHPVAPTRPTPPAPRNTLRPRPTESCSHPAIRSRPLPRR